MTQKMAWDRSTLETALVPGASNGDITVLYFQPMHLNPLTEQVKYNKNLS